MAFSLYFVGFVVFVAGLASLATALGLSDAYVTGIALVLLAGGLALGIVHRRAKGPRAAA